MSRQTIIDAILHERAVQDQRYSTAHDADHMPFSWFALINQELQLALPDEDCETDPTVVNPQRWRRQLLRVAATTLAALEALERRQGVVESGRLPFIEGPVAGKFEASSDYIRRLKEAGAAQ